MIPEVDAPARTSAAAPGLDDDGDGRARSDRPLAWLLLIGGGIGLLGAFALLVERIRMLQDPAYIPSCSLSPVLSCGSVMGSEQASLLGFPNPILGVAGFAVVVTTGAAVLAGGRLARWYWGGLQVGVIAALALVGWLIFHSLYSIGALCPYCMVVWAVTVPIAVGVTARNLRTGVLPAPRREARWFADYAVLIVVGAFLLVMGLAAQRFWSYWVSLLP